MPDNAAADNALVGHYKNTVNVFFFKYGVQRIAAFQNFRFPVGQHRQRSPKKELNGAAITCFDRIHRIPS